MSHFFLSTSAEKDLDEIDLRTIELFGFDQADKTDAEFFRTFQKLAKMPGMGHKRHDLDPPNHEFLYWTVLRQFLVVNQAIENGIMIARIIDASRDLRSVLTTDSGQDDSRLPPSLFF